MSGLYIKIANNGFIVSGDSSVDEKMSFNLHRV